MVRPIICQVFFWKTIAFPWKTSLILFNKPSDMSGQAQDEDSVDHELLQFILDQRYLYKTPW